VVLLLGGLVVAGYARHRRLAHPSPEEVATRKQWKDQRELETKERLQQDFERRIRYVRMPYTNTCYVVLAAEGGSADWVGALWSGAGLRQSPGRPSRPVDASGSVKREMSRGDRVTFG